MSTVESPVMRELFTRCEALIGSHRVQYGGSVPNLATELPHSYHRSWQDSPHDDGYSVHYSGDKSPTVRHSKSEYSCGFDLTFHDPLDIQKATARLHHWVTTTDLNWKWATVGRSPVLREFAGTLDSKSVYAMDVTQFRRPARTFGWDPSHLWHIHFSFNRCHITNRSIIPVILHALGDW